jgi:hypothetical protein
MNIDIVNRLVAGKLNIKESKVKLINQYYWHCVYRHLYDYNPNPVNIEGVCSIYPEKKLVKDAILKYIKRVRQVRKSKKFRPNSIKQQTYIERYTNMVAKFYKIRKTLKYTN